MDYPKSKAAELRLVGDKFADRAGGVPGSVIPGEDWANPVTDELIGLQTLAGLAATEGDNTQVGLAAQTLARGGALGFRAKPQNPETLSLNIEAGAFYSAVTGLIVSRAAQTAGPITAPAVDPRNDIVYIDVLTGDAGIATGTEDPAPIDPAIPSGKAPIKRIRATVGMTDIKAADVDEIRYLWSMGIDLSPSFGTGDAKLTLKTAADPGWVLADDGTIGDAGSGATNRANADTEALFTLLWDNIADAYAPVSGGRGASAAADWAAAKNIQLGTVVGRALGIAGAGSGLTSRALGEALGEETHLLTEAEMPAHSHGLSTVAVDGSLSSANPANGPGSTVQTGSTGGDGAHNNMQPSTFLNVMIRL